MFVIHSILPHHCKLLKDVIYENGEITLAPKCDSGEFITGAIAARMAYSYCGFEVDSEVGVEVALLKPNPDEIPLNNTNLSVIPPALQSLDEKPPAPIEVKFRSPAETRELMNSWAGSIKLHIRLSKTTKSPIPRFREAKIGYYVPGEPLMYVMDFALPNLFNRPVQLNRIVRPNNSGTAVPFPPGLKPDRVGKVFVHAPEHPPILASADSTAVRLKEPIPLAPCRLVFEYSPPISHQRGLVQISEVPCIVLRLLDGTNYRKVEVEDTIRLTDNQFRCWCYTYTYDQIVEATAIAETMADAQSIAQNLLQIVHSVGRVYLPGFGLIVPLQARAGVRQNPETNQRQEDSDRIRRGNLESASIRFALINILEGETVRDIDAISTTPFRVI